jgi:hypothetical protein
MMQNLERYETTDWQTSGTGGAREAETWKGAGT